MSVASRLLRPSWMEIDLDAPAENLRAVRRLVGPGRKIFAVLKADGYGFGAREMAQVFAGSGADALAFADLGDAVWIRRQGVSLPILVFPNMLPGAAAEIIANRLIPTLTDLDEARVYSASAREPLEVFVKVDAGLERLGVPAEQALKVITAISELPGLVLGGVCTHLHAPAAADPAYIAWQFGRFTAVLDGLAAAGIDVPVKLAASSPLVMQHGETYLTAVDPGSMLYGVPQSFAQAPAVPLRPALRALKTCLIHVKELSPRERFAAEAPFPIPGAMRLGVVAMGSADGLAGLHDGRVLVRGRSAPILSGPSLEHTRIDLTAVPDARVGDEVVVIGRQGDEEITPAAVASAPRARPAWRRARRSATGWPASTFRGARRRRSGRASGRNRPKRQTEGFGRFQRGEADSRARRGRIARVLFFVGRRSPTPTSRREVPMRYRPFGKTGLQVSAIGFGCWPMAGDRYGAIEDDEAVKAIHRALRARRELRGHRARLWRRPLRGGRGPALAGRRKGVILVTKCGVKVPPPGQLGPLRDSSRANVLREVDASLEAPPDRLGGRAPRPLARLRHAVRGDHARAGRGGVLRARALRRRVELHRGDDGRVHAHPAHRRPAGRLPHARPAPGNRDVSVLPHPRHRRDGLRLARPWLADGRLLRGDHVRARPRLARQRGGLRPADLPRRELPRPTSAWWSACAARWPSRAASP